MYTSTEIRTCIRSSEKFLSFHKEIMDVLYYFIELRMIIFLFYQNKDHNVPQIRFHVCIKMHRFCKRKTHSGQPNTNVFAFQLLIVQCLLDRNCLFQILYDI